MKRVFIIHRWAGTPKSDWYPWLKKKLEEKGFEVHVPKMPFDKPKMEESVSFLKKTVGDSDDKTYFISHSIGCQAIMRFLEKENSKIGGAVFVAGWFKLDNLEDEESKEIAKPWMETPINYNKLKKNVNKLTVILSSNEPYGFVKENERIFKEKLGAKVIIEENKGHFTEDDGITDVQFLMKEISNIIQ